MANFTATEAGVKAWLDDQPYHRSKKNKPRVYHTDNECTAGMKIELRNLREGQRGRPCRRCAT